MFRRRLHLNIFQLLLLWGSVVGGLGFICQETGLSAEKLLSNIDSLESTKTPLQTSNPLQKTYTLYPYTLQIRIPIDWSLGTTEKIYEPTQEKCVTYRVTSPLEFTWIVIEPFCGEGGWGPDDCPSDAISIGNIGDQEIVRYAFNGLKYSMKKDGACWGMISLGNAHLDIQAYYQGPESEWSRYLSQIDQIVLSIQDTK